MTVDLSSPESETGSTDSGTWGGDEGMCELSQGRGVRRGPNPDRQRCNEYVRALVHQDSIPDKGIKAIFGDFSTFDHIGNGKRLF